MLSLKPISMGQLTKSQVKTKVDLHTSTQYCSPRLKKKMNSRINTQSFKDGSSYTGEVHVDGTRDGKGIMYLGNGDIYAGDWKNDKFQGYGTYIFANGERYFQNIQFQKIS